MLIFKDFLLLESIISKINRYRNDVQEVLVQLHSLKRADRVERQNRLAVRREYSPQIIARIADQSEY